MAPARSAAGSGAADVFAARNETRGLTAFVSRLPARLKWHMLRRRKSDAPFLRENLVAALKIGAACEVDIAFTADGHALCLHDPSLDRETTGRGLVATTTR